MRPLVRQTFRLNELLDMILSVAGKDVARVRQLLHSGTVVYHFYRYSWAGFDASEAELRAALAQSRTLQASHLSFQSAQMPYLKALARSRSRSRFDLRQRLQIWHLCTGKRQMAAQDRFEIRASEAEFRYARPISGRRSCAAICRFPVRTNAIFEGAGANPKRLLDLDRASASKRRLFRGQSFWDRLMEIAAEGKPAYQKYSYGRRADLYELDLDEEKASRIEEAVNRLAPTKLRSALRVLPETASIASAERAEGSACSSPRSRTP